MKKFFALTLAALMLCGCDIQPPVETSPTIAETAPPETQAPTEEVVINHEALEIHALPYDSVTLAAPMGDDILLFVGQPTTLVKLDGKKVKKTDSAALKITVDTSSSAVRVGESGVCFDQDGALVFMDANLKEIKRVLLPENAQPAVAADLQTIYYTTGNSLRSIHRDSGRDRLIRETTYHALTIAALRAEDTIAECRVTDEHGKISTLFISTQTGELCRQYENQITLSASGEGWFATISEDGYEQHLVSSDGQSIMALTPPETTALLAPIPVLGGVMGVSFENELTTLSFYDSASGTTTALMTLDGNSKPESIWGDPEENCIWFLLDGHTLCRWDLTESSAGDSVSCLGPYHTRENPDTEGLAALEPTAQALEERFGVRIHIAEDAAAVLPGGYTLVTEYRVDPLADGLQDLTEALELFTPEFLAGVGKASADNRVHICLVRSIAGSAKEGTLDTMNGIQFWDAGGTAYIVLALGDTMEQSFCHTLAHVIDARVMSRSSALDNWEQLNPKDFEYDYGYISNEVRDGSAHTDAFIDTFAMSFPVEDRARIFEYAMMDGSEDLFQSETMQKKLSALCTGIRKAFGLKDSEEVLPWEQYLNP